jgi:peptide/nickel transport system substrate-binding protein
MGQGRTLAMPTDRDLASTSDLTPLALSRRKLLKISASAAAGLGLLGVLQACAPAASPGTSAGTATAAAVAGKSGGSVVYGYGAEPAKINMLLSNLIVDYDAAQLVYSFLVKVNDKLEFIPDLAVDVPTKANGGVSADGLTYTFKLRSGVKFHDGQPLTSADVKFTQDLMVDPKTQARTRVGYSSVGSVETPDANTVVFKLKETFPAFLEVVAYTNILPQHLWAGKDVNTDVLNREPVGSGPFKFKERLSGQRVGFTRNADYYRTGLPKLDDVVFKVVPDANALLAQIQTGEIQATQRLPTQHVAAVTALAGQGVTLFRTQALADYRIWLNVKKPALQDVRVRQALSFAIDRQGIIDNVIKGYGKIASGYIPPQVWAADSSLQPYAYDPAKAKSLLATAGWTAGADGILQKNGAKLSLQVWNVTGVAERLQVLQFIQAQWKTVGVDMVIAPTDSATLFGSTVPDGKFDGYYGYWTNNIDPALLNTFYLSSSSANTTGYANAEMDKVLIDAASLVDQDKRKPLYVTAQQIEYRDQPMLHLYWVTQFDVAHSILNFKPNMSFQTASWNVEEWALSA